MPDDIDFLPSDEDGWPIGQTEEDAHLGCAGRGYADEHDLDFEDPVALAREALLD